MAEYLSPGNRVRQVKKGPIAPPGIATAIGGFQGIAERGPVDLPTQVFSFEDFQAIYGKKRSASDYMWEAVRFFFKMGGSSCFINRTIGASSATASRNVISTAQCMVQSASSPGAWANNYKTKNTRVNTTVTVCGTVAAGSTTKVTVASVAKLRVGDQISITKSADTQRGVIKAIDGLILELKASITVPGGGYSSSESVVLETVQIDVYDTTTTLVQTLTGLRMDPLADENYFVNKVNGTYRTLITVTDSSSADADPRPANDSSPVALGTTVSGSDGSAVSDTEWKGTQSAKTGIWAWDKCPTVNMISIPGIYTTAVEKEKEAYAALRDDVIVVTSCASGQSPSQAATIAQTTVNYADEHTYFVWPWPRALASDTGLKTAMPPDGWVQGAFARAHKAKNFVTAPAGSEYGVLVDVIDLEYDISDSEYDTLYPLNINAIRNFPGEGIMIYGIQSMDPTGEFAQINVVFGWNIVKRECKKRTRFTVFAENNADTQSNVTRVYTAYFRELRTSKILDGDTDKDAFFIVCNDTNNTALDKAKGRLNTRVGLNFTTAVEFSETTLESDTRKIDALLASSK